jgi:acetyl/propionyl-CoA carboxylase alpha subunit
MQTDFERVAIVNRGEAAMRFIHAAREYNREYGTHLATIALYTEPDRHAMFVRQADEAVSLGAAQVIDEISHHPKSSYVDYRTLVRALTAVHADAVWVGWGFVAEHAAFADLCRDLGVVFIGPDGDAMRRLGDKIASKLLAEAEHIPVAPWSGGPVETICQAEHEAARLGYPLLIKATAGGGGHGIRLVHSATELPNASSVPALKRSRHSATPPSFWSNWWAGRAMSRSRSSPTIMGILGPSACATAPSSGATRRFSKRRLHRCCPRPGRGVAPGGHAPL